MKGNKVTPTSGNNVKKKKKTKNIQKNNKPRPMLRAAPLAQARVFRTENPSLAYSKNGGTVRIRHREYIQDVASTSAYTVYQLQINPGKFSTFPWLSGIAQQFENYRFEKLRFLFETDVSASVSGILMMAVDYDSMDNPPSNKPEFMSMKGAVRSVAWQEAVLTCSNTNLHREKMYFVVPDTGVSGSRLEDVGKLFVAVSGVSGTSAPIGSLYVDYDVVFSTPQKYSLLSPSCKSRGVFSGTSGVSSLTPFGTTPTYSGSLPLMVSTSPNNKLILSGQAGRFYMLYFDVWCGSVGSGQTALFSGLSGGSIVNCGYEQWGSSLSNQPTLYNAKIVYCLNVTDNVCILTMNIGGKIAGLDTCNLRVAELEGALGSELFRDGEGVVQESVQGEEDLSSSTPPKQSENYTSFPRISSIPSERRNSLGFK